MASDGDAFEEEEDGVEEMETEITPEPNDATPSPQPLSPSNNGGSPEPQSPAIGPQPENQQSEAGGGGEEGKRSEERVEEDASRSEGHLQCVIENFSELKQSVLGGVTYIRNLPWRLLVMPRDLKSAEGLLKGLGVFVQCAPESPESTSWNVAARATITIVNHKDPQDSYSRDIYHLFNGRENDWGYSNFLAWKDVLDPFKGFYVDNTIVLQAVVSADAPHGINWDSRKHTGYVGLKNQGATCYMNSLLQTLYCTNKLRKAVYLMPTENDDPAKSVPLALQRLFYELQHSDKPVGTKKLTKSFGWDTIDIFMQHDVQELSRVLLDNIENKMKGTVVEGTIPQLFEGKMESFIRCTSVDYESTRVETFFDIQLNIKGNPDVYQSFKDYVSVETMDGDNKYDAGENGLQEAKKGVIFLSLPPVLHLQLMRFQYDPMTDTNVKINDRYEFSEKLELDMFLKGPEDTPASYTLHAVLVHSGDNYGGHYVAYLNPRGDGKLWLKFDDDVVSTCSKKDAIENNFGGSDDTVGIRSCTNAYMLVYIRDSCLADVLMDVKEEDISESLVKRFAEEKRQEAVKRKERSEAHLFLAVEMYLEDDFQGHQGSDLVDFDEVKPRLYKVLKSKPYPVFCKEIAHLLGYPSHQIRIWPFERRSNHTTRPGFLESPDEPNKTVFQHADMKQTWRIFVETLHPDSERDTLPSYDYQTQVLLFFKYYDPAHRRISYVGHSVECIESRFSDLFPLLREKACLLPDTQLLLFEEVKPSMVEKINPNIMLNQLEEIRDGDIICFQRAGPQLNRYTLPTVVEYFRDLYNRVEVLFCDKHVPADPGIPIVLNQRMNYVQMAKTVAQVLNADPLMLQFFRQQLSHRHVSDQPIRCTNEGSLRDFVGFRHRLDSPPVLFYQRLSIPIDEFESKKWFRCIYVSLRLKEEKEFTVYVDKNGVVENLLEEAVKEVTFNESSTKQLRLLEVMTNRIVDIHPPEKPVSELYQQKMYRIEEVRREELEMGEDEALIPVAHFWKAAHNVFGVPFLLKITNGERISSVAARIKGLLDVPEKDFDKWRFAIVQTIQPFQYLSEENDDPLQLSQFLINPSKGVHFPRMGMPWLGLDHVNKNPKRTRYTLEKAIKIHN